jgi:hypothetical protein
MSAQPQQTYAATDGYELAVVERVKYANNEPTAWARRAVAMIANLNATVPVPTSIHRFRIERAARPSHRI